MVDRSSNLFAAGVRPPIASALRGVHEGGGIDPFLALPPAGVRAIPGTPSSPALVRRLFAAFVESLCDMRSRAEGATMWKGVLGGGMLDDASAGSSD